MISIEARVTNLVFRLLPHDKEGEVHDYVAERRRNDIRPPTLPKGVALDEFDLNGHIAERITKKGNDRGLLFFIHGGGFTTGSAKERRIFTYYAVDHFGYDCISINYRLAPENRWPAQIEDCYLAYENVLKMGYDPGTIVFAGESAGGTAVLSLALLAKKRGLPLPKAILAFSPCTDQYRDLPSHRNNIETDYMLKDAVAKGLFDVLLKEGEDRKALKDPLLSPYYGDYDGIPPIFLSVSDSETLCDDTLVLCDKLKKQGHRVQLVIEHGLCHAYPILPYMPEARKTLEKAFAFADKI